MPVVPAPPPPSPSHRLLTRLFSLTLLLMGCQPDPIQLLPLPPGMDYPWRLSPGQHAVLEAQTRVHDALEQGGGTHSGASADPTMALRPTTPDSVADVQTTAALPIEGSSTDAHWDFGFDDSESVTNPAAPLPSSSHADAPAHEAEPLSPPHAGPLIELNTATQAQLESLPRVGPAMAERIMAARPFRRVEDLRRVRGIGPATWELLQPLVTVEHGYGQ
ncbi:MAG: helix-hairpin-helix domain-containing protein [Myxococcales bacterium]|nr:helix-hairpin-helix domain-containing protein [Myxococcales bacterium]